MTADDRRDRAAALAAGLRDMAALVTEHPHLTEELHYGGTQAHGRRVLPTERGLSALERWSLCDTVSGGWAGVS